MTSHEKGANEPESANRPKRQGFEVNHAPKVNII
jgi:hypothetical protein